MEQDFEGMIKDFEDEINKEGIFVVGFSFPVVPRGEARIRVQISAAHSRDHLDKAISAFTKVGKELNLLNNNS